MRDVARMARGKPVPARALAAQDGLAPRQFESVLQDLVRAGLLRSSRGPQGGYALGRERRRISLAAIVRAMADDPVARTPGRPDPLARVLTEAGDAFMACLDAVSLEDLCRGEDAVASEPAGDVDFHI